MRITLENISGELRFLTSFMYLNKVFSLLPGDHRNEKVSYTVLTLIPLLDNFLKRCNANQSASSFRCLLLP